MVLWRVSAYKWDKTLNLIVMFFARCQHHLLESTFYYAEIMDSYLLVRDYQCIDQHVPVVMAGVMAVAFCIRHSIKLSCSKKL